MTTELDRELVPAALEIINTLGVLMTFRAVGTQTYDDATGKNVESSVVNHSRKAAPPLEYEEKYIDGELIRKGDHYSFVAASGLTFTPVLGMEVTHASVVWTIVSVITHTTGDSIAAYELRLRK